MVWYKIQAEIIFEDFIIGMMHLTHNYSHAAIAMHCQFSFNGMQEHLVQYPPTQLGMHRCMCHNTSPK